MWQAVPTALAASFSPATLVIVAELLSRRRPLRLAAWCLGAALALSLAIGFVVVEVLAGSGLDNARRHPTAPPALDVALGAAALAAAVVVARRRPRSPKPPSRTETRVLTAAALGLAVGSPSPLYLAALHSVAETTPGDGLRAVDVVVLALVVLVMAELPVAAYLIAPGTHHGRTGGGQRLVRPQRPHPVLRGRGRRRGLLHDQGRDPAQLSGRTRSGAAERLNSRTVVIRTGLVRWSGLVDLVRSGPLGLVRSGPGYPPSAPRPPDRAAE